MIDYMAEIREKIAALQELAENSRSCATAIIDLLLDDVVKICNPAQDDSVDEFLGRMQDAVVSQADQAATSPEYEPPGSPEYIPPQPEEDKEGGAGFQCKICSAKYSGMFDVFEHLEEEHKMDGDNEEELEANCIAVVVGEGTTDKSEAENSDKSELKEAAGGDVNVCVDGELASPATPISDPAPPIVAQSPEAGQEVAEPEKENVITP